MANQRDLEHLQNESKVFIFERILGITDPFAIIIFQVKENPWDTKPLISIDLSPSDPLADWANGRVPLRLLPAQTRGLRGGRYYYDLLVIRNGIEHTYEYKGLFKLEATISRTDETVDPVVINDIYANLISTADGKGSSLVGVAASYWTVILSAANLTVDRCLRWLNENKLSKLNPFTGSKLLKSGSNALQVLESGIGIDASENISGVKSLSLLDPPTIDSHATRKDWVVSTIQTALNGLINGAPGALDTLKELADAMGDDPNFATTIINSLAGKMNLADIGTLVPSLVSGKIPVGFLPPSSASVTSVNGLTGVVTISFPVTSVNGQTGAIVIDPIPIGCVLEDPFDQLEPARYKIPNGQSVSRSTSSDLWNLIHKDVSAITPATDRINSASHGCTEGQLVKFSFTGGGVTAGTKYYVRNPTTNDFQISATPTGAVIDLTATQSGTMITNVEYNFGDGTTTFNLPDRRGIFARGAGVHGSRAKAANGNYNGGAVGFEGQDQGQGHLHGTDDKYLRMKPGTSMADGNTFGISTPIGIPTTDGINGPPRFGDENTPAYVAIKQKVRVL
ncbi:hypothetical protein [Leptospira stimsonii]|uniref:Phage tail protein n=1 Tax=Leptospira stimsonii TaxID=2202203 RepID=A0ABY2N587_9LEPT|nr:hypothetical protein [Leptospira stimsonii]TGK10343.1 hypothetical protein EHO98_22790 [Leptospira stimsonii]TGM17254.1 hypothetical protein EHQ90_07675 [Leptospira stimsonii]